MQSLNKATLIGRLGRDPEFRTTQTGTEIANLSLATSESWKDKTSGEWKEKTEWHRAVIFNEHLVKVAKKLVKGSMLYLEGSIETRKWTDQSGAEKYSTEIVLRPFNGSIIILDKQEKTETNEPVAQNNFDDDIPF